MENSNDEYKDNDRFWGSKSGGNESNAKPSFSDISKAKTCILAKAQASEASSKAKVQASGSNAKVQTSGSKAKVQTSWSKAKVQASRSKAKTQASGSKTFGVKIPPTMTCVEEEKEKRKIIEIIMLSSNNSDDRKGPSITSVPKERLSIKGLLEWYGYDTIDEYLEETYFPSTDKDITDKDNTDEDTIHESYSPMSKGNLHLNLAIEACICKQAFAACNLQLKLTFTSKHLQVASKHLQVASKHLQLAIATCNCILQLQASICSLQVQLAFTSKHLQLEVTACICSLYQFASKQVFTDCICKHFASCKQAFTACNCSLQLQASICSLQLQLEFVACTSLQASKQAFAACNCSLHLQASICRLLTRLLALATTKLNYLLALAATNQLLPIMADKYEYEKRKKEKLEEVKARL
ncbi:hypothetical protein Tco_0199960, partial [Tanacetum coccineum]